VITSEIIGKLDAASASMEDAIGALEDDNVFKADGRPLWARRAGRLIGRLRAIQELLETTKGYVRKMEE
jgi:hypothetical protein